MRLLLDTINDKHYVGDKTQELVLATGRITFDAINRRILIDGQPDTVTFSSDYNDIELGVEFGIRALKVLTRDHGFIHFNEVI